MKSNPAVPCPDCKTLIPMDLETLITGGVFACPKCGLNLKLSQDSERKIKPKK